MNRPDGGRGGRKGGRWVLLALFFLILPGCAAGPEGGSVRTAPPEIRLPLLLLTEDADPAPGPGEHLIALTDKRVREILARGPELLVGLERGQISAILGQPDFVRHDAPAEVWMYQSPACHLDLFFYSGEKWRENMRDKEKKQIGKGAPPLYRVTFFEIRSRGVFQATGSGCLSSLINRRLPA